MTVSMSTEVLFDLLLARATGMEKPR